MGSPRLLQIMTFPFVLMVLTTWSRSFSHLDCFAINVRPPPIDMFVRA